MNTPRCFTRIYYSSSVGLRMLNEHLWQETALASFKSYTRRERRNKLIPNDTQRGDDLRLT